MRRKDFKKRSVKTRYFMFLMVVLLTGCAGNKREKSLRITREIIEDVSSAFIPDGRVNVFRVAAMMPDNRMVLKGETNLSHAKSALIKKLDSANIRYTDSVEVLPGPGIDTIPFAVVNVSVANIRRNPGHSSELVTQALMGFPLKVLDVKGGWCLVKGADHYVGWVDDGGITLMSREDYHDYVKTAKIIVTSLTGTVRFRDTDISDPVTDMVAGDILVLKSTHGNFYHVSLPDGRSGYVKVKDAMVFPDFLNERIPAGDALVSTARTMLGIPYLWGGTSVKGMDCSGFTKTVYFLNGIVLPRDADQQADIGITIDSTRQFGKLQPGDLLFFGRKTPEEDITHVGMWIGNMEFINASGMIKIASMDSLSDEFDRYNYNRYIKANRIVGTDPASIEYDSMLFSFK